MIVEDNGPGITQDIIGKVFLPFFTTKPAGSSTGLGLSICGEILMEFGGTITVESEIGQGTKFFLSFSNKIREILQDKTT